MKKNTVNCNSISSLLAKSALYEWAYPSVQVRNRSITHSFDRYRHQIVQEQNDFVCKKTNYKLTHKTQQYSPPWLWPDTSPDPLNGPNRPHRHYCQLASRYQY